MRKRPQHHVLAARHAPFDIGQHILHGIALKPVLRAAEVAGNDREFHSGCKFCHILFGAIGKRAHDHQVAFVIQQLRRHAGQPATMEEIHEEGLENILAVMAEQQRVAALLPRDAVEIAATKPRTERTIGAAGRHLFLHD